LSSIRHYDLFAGIGGFSLALERAFYDREIRHTFIEKDDFCRAVLQKHWPDGEYYEDIREFNAGYREQPRTDETFLTGVFPCQPFSVAGKRKGTEDDRYLWPEMFRAIQLTKPDWIIAENVGGFISFNGGLVLEQVYLDLEAENYEVQSFIIPAVAVNAPHRRDRIWIVAHRKGERPQEYELRQRPATTEDNSNATNTQSERGLLFTEQQATGQCAGFNRKGGNERSDWDTNWLEVATKFCRVDDGIPKRLDRNPRLKALGNAIVPQVAEEIFKAIRGGLIE